MTIRTAKGSFSAATFAALATHQDEMQGSFPAVEIGEYTVDVDGAETAEDMAASVLADLIHSIEMLQDEAIGAGDSEQVRLCAAALSGDIAALEACCAIFCDTAAQD